MSTHSDKQVLSALGDAIRRRRLELGMSQEQYAERCGLHRTYVGAIERGERNLSFSNLVRLAHALGIQPSALLMLAERELNDA
jgi:transcriptional regulator with XRE-family HTH domain